MTESRLIKLNPNLVIEISTENDGSIIHRWERKEYDGLILSKKERDQLIQALKRE